MIAVALLAIFALGLVGCGRATPTTVDRRDDVAVYVAVLRSVAELPTTPATVRRRVFVEPLDKATQLPLDVQAAVVADLKDVADLRFIDERQEAIDDKLPGWPVRDGGVLIALGSMVEVDARNRTLTLRRSSKGDAPGAPADQRPGDGTFVAKVELVDGDWTVERIDKL